MNVPAETIEALPYCAGVYYFKDKGGKVVYVGKAINLKYRVKSHFTNNAAGKRRQEMIRNICSIEYKECATEMMAIVLESIEIKRLWPIFNRSQKRYEATYGLYAMEDRKGRIRLLVDKKKKCLPAIHTFSKPEEGFQLVSKLAGTVGINVDWVFGKYQPDDLLPLDFNDKIHQLIGAVRAYLPDFALVEKGEDAKGQPWYVAFRVEKGVFTGMACFYEPPREWETINEAITAYPENEFIRSTLFNAAERQTGYMVSPTPKKMALTP
jgi:DNA polymerase-3 subunit epsilon